MRKTDQNLVTVKGTTLPDQNQEADIESKCWVLFIISTLPFKTSRFSCCMFLRFNMKSGLLK